MPEKGKKRGVGKSALADVINDEKRDLTRIYNYALGRNAKGLVGRSDCEFIRTRRQL